jgi:serine/threonine-protein kinase
MRAALDDAAKALPPPQPLPLAGLSGEAATGEPTRLRPPAPPTVFDQDAPVVAPAPVRTKPPRARRALHAPRATHVVTVVVALAVVAALAAGAVAVAGVVGGDSGGSVAVPSLVGMPQANATFKAAGSGLSVRIDYRTTYDAENLVIGQEPPPGTFLGRGKVVQLVVSRGPPKVAIPAAVLSMSVDDATAALQHAGFVVGPPIHQNSETVDEGSIIQTQPPAGTAVHQDATVQLVISDGPAPVTIPDVTKMSYDDAAAKLTSLGFNVSKGKDVYSADIAKGNVASTNPPIGTLAPKGSTVTISLSKGPEMVDVPDVRRQTLDVATARLQALGLVVDTRGYLPGDKVIAQDPQGGTSVAKGSTITLFF